MKTTSKPQESIMLRCDGDCNSLKRGECLSCQFEDPFSEGGIIRCGWLGGKEIPWDYRNEKLLDESFCPIIERSPVRTINAPVEVVEVQNTIIRLQSDVIDELFILLMQHIGAEEADQLPVLRKINEAAKLRNEIPGAEVYDPVPTYIR